MNKKSTIIISILILAIIISGCGSTNETTLSAETEVSTETVESLDNGLAVKISSKNLDLDINTVVSSDFEYLFSKDTNLSAEDVRLKKFSYVSCMDAHNNVVVTFDGESSVGESDNKSFLKKMGFEDIEEFAVGENSVEDKYDTNDMICSRKSIGDNKWLVNISLCATMSPDEWCSNFDIGSNSKNYGDTHKEWSEKQNHKGFDVTANRAISLIKGYLSSDILKDSKIIINVNGYSRGAAIANLIAKKIIDDSNCIGKENVSITAYTFATPNTTTDESAHDSKYLCIKNYINEDDLIPSTPPQSLGFVRYGDDHTFSIENNNALEEKYNNYTGKDYDSYAIKKIKNSIEDVLNNREEIYTVLEDLDHTCNYEYDNINDIQSEIQSVSELINKYDLDNYWKPCDITTRVDGDKTYYNWSYYFSDELVINVLERTIKLINKGDTDTASRLIDIVRAGKYYFPISVISLSIIWEPEFLRTTHFPTAYYIGVFEK